MDCCKEFIEKLRLFHFSTVIPVRFIANGTTAYSLPDQIESVDTILKDDAQLHRLCSLISNEYTQPKSFYFKNEYEECFIVIHFAIDQYILAGPFLTEKILEGQIDHMIRNRKITIKLKNRLLHYYQKLMVINDNRYYYCGKLLERLFAVKKQDISSTMITSLNDTSNDYFRDSFFVNSCKNRESLFHHPPYFLEQELISKIKAGDLKKALRILKEINSLKKARLSKDPIRSLKNSLIGSVTFFIRAIIESGVHPEEAFILSDSYILQIENTNDFSKLIELEYDMLKGCIDMINHLSKNTYSNVIQQTLSYIYNHLTKKLSLQTIAAAVYVHPNYLCSLFKKEVGMPLPDYIMKKRIEEAKYLIRYSNSSIADIAAFFQFCNQSYFTQIFKKHTGLTPKQYRMKKQLKNQASSISS